MGGCLGEVRDSRFKVLIGAMGLLAEVVGGVTFLGI